MADAENKKDYAVEVGKSIFDELQRQFAAAWEQVSTADRELLERVSNDAAVVALEVALTPVGPMRDAAVGEKRHVDAQLANLESVATETARGVFWVAVKTVLQRMIGLAFVVL